MLDNGLQYRLTLREAGRFEEALAHVDEETTHLDALPRQGLRNALEIELANLQAQVAEYEVRVSHVGTLTGADGCPR